MHTPDMPKSQSRQNTPSVQTNIYYRAIHGRRNLIGETIFAFFMGISSYPKLVIEVFIRKNMGDRYFTPMSAITVGILLFYVPWIMPGRSYPGNMSSIIMDNPLWYLFIAVFAFFSFLRYKEIMRKPGTYDFNRFSKSDGEILPIFKRTKFTMRQIEIYLEPLSVLLLGLLLAAIGQKIPGLVFTFCAIVYSVSKMGDYRVGDNFIKDKIDILLNNEDLRNDFLGKGKTQSEHGFKFRGPIPSDPEIRQQLYNSFFEAEQAPLAY